MFKLNIKGVSEQLVPPRILRHPKNTNSFILLNEGYLYNTENYVTFKAYDTMRKRFVTISVTDVKDFIENELAVSSKFGKTSNTIVPNIETFSISANDYLISEYYSLFTEYMKSTPLKSNSELVGREERTDVAVKLILALDELHTKGFVHQNLTEKALVWDFFKETVRLRDFSNMCSLDLDCDENDAECGGSCGYLGGKVPPERQADLKAGKEYSDSTNFEENVAHDIWSLGILLLRWYTDSDNINDMKNITNHFAKELLPLLLTNEMNVRVTQWDRCVKLAKKAPIVPFQVKSYNDFRKNFIKPSIAETVTLDFAKLLNTKVPLRKTPKDVKYTPNKIETSDKDVYIFIDDGYVKEGTFGAVFTALSCVTGEIVAVKLVKSNEVKEVLHEIDALKMTSAICNEYVVCYRDHYVVSGNYRIVLDYIKGGYNLNKYMKQIPLLSTGEMVGRQDRNDIAKSLLTAIDKLHNTTYLSHQDLKEGNLLWDFQKEEVRITDLGEICSFDNNCGGDPGDVCDQPPCGFVGTYYTSNPEMDESIEQGSGVYSIDPPNFEQTKYHDIWSVGVILLRWYTYKEFTKYNYDHIYKWSDAKIQAQINTIKGNDFAKKILHWLLERDPYKRSGNWDNCIAELKSADMLDYSTDKYNALRNSVLQDSPEELDAKQLQIHFELVSTAKKAFMNSPDGIEKWSINKILQLLSNTGRDINKPFLQLLPKYKKYKL